MTPRPLGGALTALALLSASLVGASPAMADVQTTGLVARYELSETTGTTAHDSSGNGRDGTVVGAATWTGGAINLPGGANNASYVRLPDGLLAGKREATVSVEVKPDATALSQPSFLWNIGGTSQTGSWFTSTRGKLRSTITPSNWSGEQDAAWTGHNLTAGAWQNVTTTLADNGDGSSTMTVYVDGAQVAQNRAVTLTPADLAAHTTNRLGGSAYADDQSFAGQISEMRVYDTALDAATVLDASTTDALTTAGSVAAAIDLGDTSAVTTDLVLPTDATWTTSDATVVTAGGAVTRPAAGESATTATLTGTVTVRGQRAVRQVTVTVQPLVAGETNLPSAESLVAHFPLNAAYQGSSTTRTVDIGGRNGGTWTPTHLDLSTAGGYIANNAFSGFSLDSDSASFSVDVRVSPSATGSPSSTLLTYGSSATATNISYRPFWTATSSAAVITVGGKTVAVAETDRAQVRGTWTNVTVVLDSTADTLTVYENGVQAARATGVTTTARQLGGSVLRLNRDATTYYNVPSDFRDLKVYRSAVTADEASALARVTAQFGWDQLVAGIDLGTTTAVTSDLVLPGAPLVTWTSSNPAVVAPDGTVTRPAPGEDDADVVLTATLVRGGQTFTKPYPVTVLAVLSDAAKASSDAAALAVHGADDLRTIVTLPSAGPLHGSQVTWSSTDTTVLPLIDAAGTTYADPVRPAYGHPAATATLTATVVSGTADVTVTVPVTVAPAARTVDDEAYAFAYFTANTVEGENIYLAASEGNNALSWTTVNGGEPVLTSTYGEKGLRDPFILRSAEGDTFYLIATDLSIGRDGDWNRAQVDGSQYVEIWESTDLVNWSEQRHVKVSPDTAGMTWAPEAYYDDERGEYVVFWASRIFTDDSRTTCITTASGAGCYARMMYSTTKDFITFSDPQIWQDTGAARIDSTVLKDGDSYYRFTKDEGGQTGCTDIIAEKSTSLTDVTTSASVAAGTGWTPVSSCIARNAGFSGAVEGPTVFKANPGDTSPFDYYLYLDNYGGSGYFPLGTDDLDSPAWTRVPGSLPASRHGTVLPVTHNQWASLTGNPAAVTGSTTSVALTDGTLTATVAAADGYEVGGAVTFTGAGWERTAYVVEKDGVATASVHLPSDGARSAALVAPALRAANAAVETTTVTARFAGTAEIAGSDVTVEVPAGPTTPTEPTEPTEPGGTPDPGTATTGPGTGSTTPPAATGTGGSSGAGTSDGAPGSTSGGLAASGFDGLLLWTLLAMLTLGAGTAALVRHRSGRSTELE